MNRLNYMGRGERHKASTGAMGGGVGDRSIRAGAGAEARKERRPGGGGGGNSSNTFQSLVQENRREFGRRRKDVWAREEERGRGETGADRLRNRYAAQLKSWGTNETDQKELLTEAG